MYTSDTWLSIAHPRDLSAQAGKLSTILHNLTLQTEFGSEWHWSEKGEGEGPGDPKVIPETLFRDCSQSVACYAIHKRTRCTSMHAAQFVAEVLCDSHGEGDPAALFADPIYFEGLQNRLVESLSQRIDC